MRSCSGRPPTRRHGRGGRQLCGLCRNQDAEFVDKNLTKHTRHPQHVQRPSTRQHRVRASPPDLHAATVRPGGLSNTHARTPRAAECKGRHHSPISFPPPRLRKPGNKAPQAPSSNGACAEASAPLARPPRSPSTHVSVSFV